MKIVKRDSFRSQGALVNKTDDMERIVIDCTKGVVLNEDIQRDCL